MSYLYHLKVCFSNKFDALYNQNTILLVSVDLLFIGEVYRYYESRRRIFNDSQPCRRDKVLQVQENTRKDRQKKVIGLAAFYAWARAKHFGCHSVCLSFCHHREVTFRSSNLNIACSTATSLSPLMGKVSFYRTFVYRDPRKV